jgi:hypothetical protein
MMFTDIIVSGKLGLLGTSQGLYRVRNNQDITDKDFPSTFEHGWTTVEIPQGLSSIACLCPVSTTGRAQDVARGAGGMVYVVNGSIGKNQARLHRLAIQGTDDAPVSDSTVEPIRDYFKTQKNTKAINTYFINLSEYKHLCSLDNATLLFARNQQGKQPAAVHALPYDMYPPVGVRSSMIKYHAANVPALPLNVQAAATITSIARLRLNGSIIVGGNFGVRMLN